MAVLTSCGLDTSELLLLLLEILLLQVVPLLLPQLSGSFLQ